MRSFKQWLSWLMLIVSAGCAHAPPPKTAPIDGFGATKPASHAPELIEIRVLLVAYRGARSAAADQQRTQPEALERARMLSSMARTGDRVSEMVPKYSDRAGAAADMGLFRVRPGASQQFDRTLIDTAVALSEGAVSEPVATAEGYYLVERLKDPPAGPERIAARHILIGYTGSPRAIPGVTRTESEARALAEKVAGLARQPNADWKALAAEYTDEAAGKTTGGDLGKFGRNQMVPAFERAAFALAVGQISDVVQSPFGFHIIQRYE